MALPDSWAGKLTPGSWKLNAPRRPATRICHPGLPHSHTPSHIKRHGRRPTIGGLAHVQIVERDRLDRCVSQRLGSRRRPRADPPVRSAWNSNRVLEPRPSNSWPNRRLLSQLTSNSGASSAITLTLRARAIGCEEIGVLHGEHGRGPPAQRAGAVSHRSRGSPSQPYVQARSSTALLPRPQIG